MSGKKKTSGIVQSKYFIVITILALPLLFTNCKSKTENKEVQTEDSIATIIEDTIAATDIPDQPEDVTPPLATSTTKPVNKPKSKPTTSNTKQTVEPATPVDDSDRIYESVETMPEFPGGNAKLMKYLNKNIKYPILAQEKGIEGNVIVQFVVYKDGSIVNPKVIKSADPSLDKEALRVVSSMPNWQPGVQGGKIVRTKYTLPITFKLN